MTKDSTAFVSVNF